jgi:hypothetical protein
MDLSLLKSIDAHELNKILPKASLFGGRVAQPTLTSSVVTVIKSIEILSDQIRIKLFEDAPLETSRPISIRLNYRDLNFNIDPKQYSVSGTTIITKIPTEARALALRPDERYVLPLHTHASVSIRRIEKRRSKVDLGPTLIDVSRKGLGLLIAQTDEDLILNHDHIWVSEINGIKLPKLIFGRIVYVLERKYKDNVVDLKVGVSLDSEIPEEIFEEIKRLCQLVLTA